MAYKLQWDQDGQRFYETGISKAALYVKLDTASSESEGTARHDYSKAYAWSGITSVSESPTGGEAEAIYADNIKYLSLVGNEEMEGSIECYTYPNEFKPCNGEVTLVSGAMAIGQQTRKKFGLVYMTEHKNDNNVAYHKLHFVYGCYATPSERSYETVNDSPEAITFSYDFTSDPVTDEITVSGTAASYTTSIVTISKKDITAITGSTPKTVDEIWEALCESVYGTTSNEGCFLYPHEIYSILTTGTAIHYATEPANG